MEVLPSLVCAFPDHPQDHCFNQQEGEKSLHGRFVMGQAWKQHVPLPLIFHWLDLS